MNWPKSIKKLTRWRLVSLEKNQKPTLVVLVAFLAFLASLERSLGRFLVRFRERPLERSLVRFLGRPLGRPLESPLVVLLSPLVRFLVRSLGRPLESPLVVLLSPLVILVALLRFLAEALVDLVRSLERKEKNGQRPILFLPGTLLKDVLHVIYSPKTAERVFDQTIRDMQDEWVEAIAKERQGLARWVRIRGVLTVLITVVVHAVTNLRSIFKLVKW